MTEKIDPKKLGDQVVKVLKTVYDPEIPVDIYELGLIYDVFLNESNDVKVLMTLTTPNCPVADSLPEEVKNKIKTKVRAQNKQTQIVIKEKTRGHNKTKKQNEKKLISQLNTKKHI